MIIMKGLTLCTCKHFFCLELLPMLQFLRLRVTFQKTVILVEMLFYKVTFHHWLISKLGLTRFKLMAQVKFYIVNFYCVGYLMAWIFHFFFIPGRGVTVHRVLFTEKGRVKFTGKLNGIKLLFMSTFSDLMDRLDLDGEKCWLLCSMLLFPVLCLLILLLHSVAALPSFRPPDDGRNMFSIGARIVSFTARTGQDWTGSSDPSIWLVMIP